MSDTQTVENTQPSLPTAQQFKSTVTAQLTEWDAPTVDGLCYSQTETVIKGLAPYYQVEEDDLAIDVSIFKQVIRDFQAGKGHETFVELTEPEVTELVALLAPYFHPSAPVANQEQAATSDASSGDLDSHPF